MDSRAHASHLFYRRRIASHTEDKFHISVFRSTMTYDDQSSQYTFQLNIN